MSAPVTAAPAESLGAGSVNSNTGKPVYVAASRSLYTANEREDLSNADRINYRNMQLQKSIEAITRRDAVYHDLAQENYTGGDITHQVLGTPYPVVEPFPSIWETYKGVRWYETAACFGGAAFWAYWTRSSAAYRHVRNPRMIKGLAPTLIGFIGFNWFAGLSQDRLMGFAENEYEADKYGVFDDKANLERKAKNWAKYAAYKEEWMRRYNYVNFNERPEESGKLMSALWLPYKPIRYNTRTDYPTRKNPYYLTTTPLRDMSSEWSFTYALPSKNWDAQEKRSADPIQASRPELAERYAGPLSREVYYPQK